MAVLQFRLHRTEASSVWTQLCIPIPLLGQSVSLSSVPVHATSSSKMGPVPAPNRAKLYAIASEEGRREGGNEGEERKREKRREERREQRMKERRERGSKGGNEGEKRKRE